MNEKVNEIIENITKEADVDRAEVEEKVKEKAKEFSGLISDEGAAHIVAKEYDVNLLEKKDRSLDIDNIVTGMSKVTVTGKVVRVFDTREFERKGEKGKVANIILADETGKIRVSFWDNQVEALIEKGKIEEGKVIKIENAYVKKDNRDNLELRLGKYGKVKESEEEISVDVQQSSGGGSTELVDIDKITPGISCKIRGNIVRIFESNTFFKTCPECGERIEEDNEKCEEHDKCQVNLVLTAVLDDGKDNIRCVFFREQAEKIIGTDTEELWEMTNEGSNMSKLYDMYEDIVGGYYNLEGRPKRNDYFERLEFLVDSVEELDPKKEIKRLIEK